MVFSCSRKGLGKSYLDSGYDYIPPRLFLFITENKKGAVVLLPFFVIVCRLRYRYDRNQKYNDKRFGEEK
jgi:hypothetical protein